MAKREMPRSAPSSEGWADAGRSPRAAASEALGGLVERVTFHNPDNGFCVLRLKVKGQRDLVTVVGHAPTISAGEFIQASGIWGQRPRAWASVQDELPARRTANNDRGHREVSWVRNDQGGRPYLREQAGARIRRKRCSMSSRSGQSGSARWTASVRSAPRGSSLNGPIRKKPWSTRS
jgi:hypothetical protein